MKTYEKPKLVALALNGNDRLCGECAKNNAYLLYKDPTGDIAYVIDWLLSGDSSDGTITRSELEGVFAAGESCKTEITQYCKFLGSNTVAWS